MKFDFWEDSGKGYLEFKMWEGVEVLFSLRGKLDEFLNYLANSGANPHSPIQIVSLHQIHSNKVVIVNGPINSEGDGLLTYKPWLWLTVSVADCLPVYIYDKNKKVIGLVHAGKRGTQNFILLKAIMLLYKRFGSIPSDISILFGPSICPKCYDYDLWGNNVEQAKSMGVSHIINPKICTAEFPSYFYSYRKEKGVTGRMVAAIKLSPLKCIVQP